VPEATCGVLEEARGTARSSNAESQLEALEEGSR